MADRPHQLRPLTLDGLRVVAPKELAAFDDVRLNRAGLGRVLGLHAERAVGVREKQAGRAGRERAALSYRPSSPALGVEGEEKSKARMASTASVAPRAGDKP